MPTRKPAAPRGLASRGKRFWTTIVGEYELNADELEVLAEACKTMDDIDVFRAVIVRDGPTVAGSKGQVRAHPAYAEMRASRGVLGRLLAQLALPDPDGDTMPSPLQARARKAAATRWDAHRRRRGQTA